MAKRTKDDDDQPDENQGNSDDSADNFGLPDIEYKPLDREKETFQETQQETVQESEATSSYRSEARDETVQDYNYDDDDEPRSRAPLIITLIIVVVVLAGGFLLYKYYYLPKKERDRQEQVAAQEKEAADAKKAEEARAKEEEDRKKAEVEAAAKAKPAEGTIETLAGRTRRFYVVVTSNVDDDLLMDYAKKLSAKGVSSKIIPPFGNVKFFRLAIADFDTYNAAQSSADGSKAEYGTGLWVIRY